MRWLHWRELWNLLYTWQGFIAAAISVLAAIYYGPKKVLEAWDWYMDRFFDQKVRDFLEASTTHDILTQHGPRKWAIAKSIPEISETTGMSEKRVSKCLLRLKRKRVVCTDGDKWKIIRHSISG
jgi:hypothetical protein